MPLRVVREGLGCGGRRTALEGCEGKPGRRGGRSWGLSWRTGVVSVQRHLPGTRLAGEVRPQWVKCGRTSLSSLALIVPDQCDPN